MSMITKRVLSLLLCFVMLVGMLPISALADDGGEGNQTGTASNVVTDQTQEGAGSQTDVKPASNEDLDENQGGSGDGQTSPEGGQTSPEGGQTSPEGGQTSPEGGQTSPEGGQTSPEGGQTNPEGGQTSPEGGQTNPEGGQTSPEGGQTSPEGGQTSPEGGQTSPEGGQTSPEGGQTDPEGGQENPDVDQSNPVETPETPADGENQETPVEEIAEDDATFTINRNGQTPKAVVFAASDFQPYSGSSDAVEDGKNVLKNIIAKMKADGYATVNGALFCGDYSKVKDTWNSEAVANNNAGRKAVADILGSDEYGWSLTDQQVVYIQGNHDPANTEGLDAFGANDTANYGVFAIHEDNFQWYQGATSNSGNSNDPEQAEEAAIATAEALEDYLQDKVDTKDSRPIFVISHVPLHYGYRTTSDKKYDNLYAQYLFDVLNEYGKKLNIIFLFGHNHSSDYDDYLGGAAVYLPAGDNINIPKKDKSGYTTYELQFTYMNAGYLGYYNGYCDTGLSATVFAIYENEVVVARYDQSGPANLKDEGKADRSGCSRNTTVYTNDSDAATINLTRKTFTEELTSPVKGSGIMSVNQTAEVSVSGLQGKSYSVVWSSSDNAIAEVAAVEGTPMTATITAKANGKVRISAMITETAVVAAAAENNNARAVGDTKTLTMDLEVTDLPMITLAPAGENTFYILDDNQDSNTWAADTTKKYVIVSQDKGNPTAGEFMALYYTGQADPTEGDDVGEAAWRELNAEPITVMPLPVNGEKLYAVATEDTEFLWTFRKVDKSDSYNWYQVGPVDDTDISLMLSKGHATDELKKYDPDNDGIRLRGNATSDGSVWRMSNRGAGLTALRTANNKDYYFAPYYDSIQGDISVYYTQNGDQNMGYRVYMYEETTVTLESAIVAYMKDLEGSVSKGVGPDAGTGDVIYIQSGNDIVEVPVTIGMLSGEGLNVNTVATYSGLKVTYAGKTITENYTLKVTEATTLLKNEGGKFRSTIYRLVDEMVGGRHYLIVDNNEAGEAHAMGATGTTNDSPVSAHNVLIQPFKVDGENGLYIDSTRYSDEPDNPAVSIIEDQGNVNANIFSADHKAAIRLVWTPSIIHTSPNSNNNAFTNVYSSDTAYRLLVSEYENGRLWINDSNKPVLFWGGSTSSKEQWKYDSSATRPGLMLDSSKVTTNYRLFYNQEAHNSSAYLNKNFITIEEETTKYNPLHSRTWLYEQDDSIDTITARINDLTGRVTINCTASAHTGDYILVETYGTDGSMECVEVPVRVSMLSGSLNTKSAGTYTGLTVTYQGKVITDNYTLVVAASSAEDDYPDFPDEGAVKLDKQVDTTVYSYLDTGAAVVNLSVTGIPAQTGVDVLFVLDTSSSMTDCIHAKDKGSSCDTCGKVDETNSRLALLQETVKKSLKQLQAPIDGYTPDIDVAVACFNGYTAINGSIQLDQSKRIDGDVSGNNYQLTRYRNDSSTVSLNFTDVAKLTEANINAAANNLYLNAGTNYDRGLELAYNMLKEKQEKDALNGETRQQILVFMSDGIPYQFNYAHGTNRLQGWSYWLMGTHKSDFYAPPTDTNARTLFNEYFNTNGQHWMAEAIKGDPAQKYKIINPDMQGSNDKIDSVYGLGATIYTVGMGVTKERAVSKESAISVLKKIATNDAHFYECNDSDGFSNAFSEIANTVRSAGDAVFTDQMGENFDLITSKKKIVVPEEGDPVTIEGAEIVLKQYALYHRSDIGNTVDGVKVTEAMAGTRRPIEPTVIEVVTFNEAGTEAYSSLLEGNIKNADGVICAQTFWYNTTSNAVNIEVGDKTVSLESECFYWNVGDVPQDELVLSYPVYLNASMEGGRPAGTYDTNTHAELNYVNHLGHDCVQAVASPKLPWEQATVGYAFYLVNVDGKPVINETTGQTGSFEQSVRITNPVYKDFLLNSDGSNVIAESVAATDVLPEGYVLFDTGAKYHVSLTSGGDGYYEIEKSSDADTTYVQGIEDTAIKGIGKKTTENYATANTIVWFAVQATVACAPDTVVIDYGLPVDIDVLSNDVMIGNDGKLVAVGNTSEESIKSGYDAAKREDSELKLWKYLQSLDVGPEYGLKITGESKNGTYGTIQIAPNSTTKVRYTLNTTNGMQMKGEETFVYAVDYEGQVGTQGYYYSTVTVIPATSIYYEDSFVNYTQGNWETAGNTVSGSVQAQDRPGEFSLSGIDANNIYGYDDAYKAMATYSMGTAQKATVSAGNSARAEFTFNGTGFDVISLTSNTTGSIVVSVKDNNRDAKKNYMVDTYYGYKYDWCHVVYEYDFAVREDGKEAEGAWTKRIVEAQPEGMSTQKPENPQEGSKYYAYEQTWVVDNSAENNALYQVPVIKVKDLPYGNYTATIRIAYSEVLDHQNRGSSEFYLDAIRIYDPANDGAGNQIVQDAYVADGEGWPEYFELRNQIISKEDFGAAADEVQTSGLVFIDNTLGNYEETTYTIEDYKNFGPNNELYLAPGQAVAFDLNVTDATLDQIHIAMKSVGNTAAKAKYFATGTTDAPVKLIETATDLYYDITDLNGKTVVIENAGGSNDAILSITNVKVTYKEAHTDDGIEKGFFQVTQQGAKEAVRTLMMMRRPAEPVEPEVPETIVPETTVPETTVPETTEPEEELRGFEPDRFEVSLSKDSVKVGSKVTVKVITSKDVEYITINGSKIAKYDSKTPKTKTWKVNVKAEEVGELDVAVVCYNKENQASEAVVNAITVKAPVFKPEKFTVSLSESSVKVGKKVTVTVTTSKDVEFITVNGSKIAKCSSQSKNAKTWKVKLAAEEVGKMKVSVVCYNKQNWASKAVVKKVTVKAPVFKPDKFTVSLSEKSVKVGKQATVTVTTSKDVKYITINGKKVTDYTQSKNTRTWKLNVKGETVGKMDVSVVCYNEDQLASKAVVKTITVKKK